MTNIISVSLPDELAKWIKARDDKSKIIQHLIKNAMQEEILTAPKLIKKELKNIDNNIVELNTKKKILLNKMSVFVKEETIRNTRDNLETQSILDMENKARREKINFIKKIPDIETLLKPAFAGVEDFDFFATVDVIEEKHPELKNKVNVSSLKMYVDWKNNGTKGG